MTNLISKFFSRRHGKPGYIEPIPLHDGPQTKRSAQLWHVRHTHPENDGLALDILKFDKPTGKAWPEEAEPEKEINLTEDEVKRLYDYLSSNFGALGIRESGRYAIIPIQEDATQLTEVQKLAASRLLRSLLRSDDADSLLQFVRNLEEQPEILGKLRDLAQLKRYETAKRELEQLIDTESNEQALKDWFKKNPWIFGTEYISREDVSQIALRHKIDLCFTSADGYQEVIELKIPSKLLLREDSSHPGSFYPSEDLARAIAQCSNYLYEIEEQRSNIERTYKLPFLKPRARIIIGRSHAWDEARRQALRKLNSAFHNIDIMTYDHVLLRADRMIEYFQHHE